MSKTAVALIIGAALIGLYFVFEKSKQASSVEYLNTETGQSSLEDAEGSVGEIVGSLTSGLGSSLSAWMSGSEATGNESPTDGVSPSDGATIINQNTSGAILSASQTTTVGPQLSNELDDDSVNNSDIALDNSYDSDDSLSDFEDDEDD